MRTERRGRWASSFGIGRRRRSSPAPGPSEEEEMGILNGKQETEEGRRWRGYDEWLESEGIGRIETTGVRRMMERKPRYVGMEHKSFHVFKLSRDQT